MKHGVFLPIFDALADPGLLADLAVSSEETGWDGVFYWDHINYRDPVQAVTDPWTAMAAAASRTERIRFGPMVTPLARRRPHVLARQTVALDRLSGGRFVLGVGLGMDTSGGELSRFGEETDARRRARMLDEALDVLDRLWSGEPVDHEGEHYRATDVRFLPVPVGGRIPVWAAARWPNRRPLRRAARRDGVFVIDVDQPSQVSEMCEFLAAERGGLDGFDVVVTQDPGSDPDPWAEAGATWSLAWFGPFGTDLSEVQRVIAAGPSARAAST